MKSIKFGNILNVTQGIIVHGCNAQGVMGSGVAAGIRNKYPKAYDDYYAKWKKDGLTLGAVIMSEVAPGLYVANAITQENYGRDPNIRYVNYRAVNNCFAQIAEHAINLSACPGLEVPLEINYPLIGAGLANGDWSIINEIIDITFHEKPHKRSLWLIE